MKSSIWLILLIIFLFFGIGIGIFIGKGMYQCAEVEHTDSDALLRESMERVLQLTLVQQDYSGVYTYEYTNSNWFGLRDKSLLLNVRATGHFGYDIDSVNFVIDDIGHVVTITLPEPSLLSLECSPSFISEKLGWLAFSSLEDYNKALTDTERDIRIRALFDSSAIRDVQNYAHQVVSILEGYARGMDYRVVIKNLPPGPA